MVSVFVWLLLAHFVCDYTFQPDFIAKHKSRLNSIPAVPWYYVLLSHAATHAAAVLLITESVVLAISELVAHFFIDWAKCESRFGIHVDQALHILCKLAWFAVYVL